VSDRHVDRLWRAVASNNRFDAEKYFDFNEVSTIYDDNGEQTLVHLAADKGHLEMLMLVLSRTGAKADSLN
jgi:ankyrin repeat protein